MAVHLERLCAIFSNLCNFIIPPIIFVDVVYAIVTHKSLKNYLLFVSKDSLNLLVEKSVL